GRSSGRIRPIPAGSSASRDFRKRPVFPEGPGPDDAKGGVRKRPGTHDAAGERAAAVSETMRTFRKSWRKAALWLAGGVLALAVLAAGLNLTGAPLGLARGVARAIEEQSGWRIDVRGAHFSGLSHLRLTEVTARPPGAGAEIRLPAVDVAVDPWKVLTGRTEGAVHAVRLVRPRLVVEEGTWRRALAALRAGAAAGRGEGGTSRPEQTGGSGRSLRVEVVDGTVEEAAPGGSTVRAWRVDGRAELAGDGWSIAGEE